MEKKYSYLLLFAIMLFLFGTSFIQQNDIASKKPDFESLQNRISAISKDQKQAFYLTLQYIELAKKNKQIDELITGYGFATTYAPEIDKPKYGDSLVTESVKTKDNRYIGMAYASAANANFKNYDYKKALEMAIIANDYLKNDTSKEFAYEGLFTISRLKNKIGDNTEAQKIANEIYEYYRWKKDQKNTADIRSSYIYTLNNLIRINSALAQFDKNAVLLEEGYSFIQNNQDVAFYLSELISSDAFNEYSQGKYPSAIQKLEKSLSLYNDSDHHFYEKFYLGMSYWKLQQDEKAFPFFQEITDDYQKTGKISLEFRPAFEFFIEYYKKKGNREKQLIAVDDLLRYEKKFKEEQNNIAQKLKTDYDEKRLIEEKENLLSERRKERWSIIGIAVLGIMAVTGFFTYQNKKNKVPQQSVQAEEPDNTESSTAKSHEKEEMPALKTTEVRNNESATAPEEEIPIVYSLQNQQKNQPPEIDFEAYLPINKYTVKQLLKSLDDFEKSDKYLSPDLRLVTLAEKFHTNDKYLSRVIKVKTGKTFNGYINDLRFAHLDNIIKTNPDFRERKIKEIAKYLGFGTPEFFATAFKEKYGKTPREYFEKSS
ncbi:MAG: AraC family transcriptional regulator [Chryseobacterium sp.]|uniref:AraC family transcriptional regulator n=1 Tax=Chryseobacterium sp. TaxID=1871047 RepID=UPI00281A6EEE|nr:AraC family transcriptional regulator [Chryseobacterium sp.]MDR2237410.1 AraC family transcriptional regulator [Chryseobacterium sp.]